MGDQRRWWTELYAFWADLEWKRNLVHECRSLEEGGLDYEIEASSGPGETSGQSETKSSPAGVTGMPTKQGTTADVDGAWVATRQGLVVTAEMAGGRGRRWSSLLDTPVQVRGPTLVATASNWGWLEVNT